MNTPAHLLMGAAVMGRKGRAGLIWAGMLGGLLPDLSLYILAGVSLLVLNIPPQVVFNELYFSDLWQGIFAVDNSFIVWGVLLGIAIWMRRGWAIALCGGALLHIATDFPLHNDDGRPHFWPLSTWVFESPLSYWDRNHSAQWVAPIEALWALVCVGLIWRMRAGWGIAITAGVLLVAEFYVVRTWLFFFIDS